MLYNIFSQIQCVLKVNGIYKGIINLNPIELNLSDQDLLQFIPLENLQAINFILSKETPQVKVAKTDICNYLYPLYFLPNFLGYKKLYSLQENTYNLDIVLDGVCKVTLSTSKSTHTEIIPFKPSNISIFYKDSRYIGLLFTLNKQLCVVLDLQNCCTIFYKYADLAYYENDTIYIKTQVSTILYHTITYKIPVKFAKKKSLISCQTNLCFALLF